MFVTSYSNKRAETNNGRYAIDRDILAIDRRQETKSFYVMFHVLLRVKYHIQLVYSLFFLSSEEFTRVCFVIRYNHFARFRRVKRIFSRVGKLKREEIKCVFAFVLLRMTLSGYYSNGNFWNKLLHTAPSIWIFSEKYSFKHSSVLLICVFIIIKISLVSKFL